MQPFQICIQEHQQTTISTILLDISNNKISITQDICPVLGESGCMLPLKILKSGVSGMLFPAFWVEICRIMYSQGYKMPYKLLILRGQDILCLFAVHST